MTKTKCGEIGLAMRLEPSVEIGLAMRLKPSVEIWLAMRD